MTAPQTSRPRRVQRASAGAAPIPPGAATPGTPVPGSAPAGGHAPELPAGAQLLASQMDEDAVEWHLRRYLKDLRKDGGHILAYHPWKTHAKRAAPGWPDWAVAGPGGFMLRELKREGRKPTKAQQEWLDYMIAAGIDAGVWYPSSVLSGEMAADLARVAGLRGAA